MTAPASTLALLNVGRLNGFKLARIRPTLYATIGGALTGAGQPQDLIVDALSINDRLNEDPNTLIATVRGAKPIEGQPIRLTLGSRSASPPLFAGTILRVTQAWGADNPRFVLYHIEATDPTWRLNGVLVTARYRQQSAGAIAADLMTRAPAGFTLKAAAGLPTLDDFTVTDAPLMDAFVQLAKRIGGHTSCDYDARVYLWTTEQVISPPRALTADHPSLAAVSAIRDLTQLVTRAIVVGGGSNALGDIGAGSPVLPVETAAWYGAGGGLVRSGAQRIQYGGVLAGGAGAFVGPGATPSTAPTVTGSQTAAAGLPAGTYQYAYSWVTAAGETFASPLAPITLGPNLIADPSAVMAVQTVLNPGTAQGSFYPIGDTYYFAYAWSPTAHSSGGPLPESWTQATAVSPPSGPFTTVSANDPLNPAQSAPFNWLIPCSTDKRVKLLLVYEAAQSTGWDWRGGRWAVNNPAGGFYQISSRGASPNGPGFPPNATNQTQPATKTNQTTLTGIAPGPAGTISRRIYRTAVNGSALKLLTTIADNTTTTIPPDTAPDASLGAAAPAGDTSGLVVAKGQINAGATSILVSSSAPFAATGGIALVADQVIRYSSTSATALLGVPPTGPGSLLASVAYGTPISVPPQLTGIPTAGAGAIQYPITKGDAVDLLVIVDDVGAQQAIAAIIGGDGVRESLIQDGRIGLTEAAARGAALVAQRGRPRTTIAHTSRDPYTRSGALLSVDLPPPTDLHGDVRIQDVTIRSFNPRAGVFPIYDARSSSDRFTFDDLLRQLTNRSPAPSKGE